MAANLNADDIARVTAEVMKKLDGQKIDTARLREAVRQAADEKSPEPAKPGPGSPVQPQKPRTPPLKSEAQVAADAGRKRIIIASFGLNRPGIVAAISAILAENVCSIEDMSQRIMQEFYTLIMIVDISGCQANFEQISEKLKVIEEKLGVTILAQHEDVFRYMHRV